MLHVQGNIAEIILRGDALSNLRQVATDCRTRTFGESVTELIMDGITSLEEAVSACPEYEMTDDNRLNPTTEDAPSVRI